MATAQKKDKKAAATTDKKGDKSKKASEAKEVKPTGAAVDAAPKVEAPAPAAAGEAAAVVNAAGEAAPKEKRREKNFTDVSLDPKNPESAAAWLASFTKQCADHPPRKGYDQHWNNLGFIHDGPALRLSNQGAARMFVFLANVFAQRMVNGDTEATEFFEFCMDFADDRKTALLEEKKAAALAAAEEIINKAGGKVIHANA